MGTKRFEVYAPVIIPTLCRFEHFKRCIDSLSKCTGAEYTDVYIGIDYPAKDEHWGGYRKICDYVKGVTGFNNLVVLLRDRNYGFKGNLNDLKEQVCKKTDRYIFTEDDNEFSPNFLEYINDGLTRFKDYPNVIRICGCLMPWSADFNKVMSGWNYNAFPAMDFNASGFGSWFDKFPVVPYTKDMVLHSWKLTFRAFQKGHCTAISRMLYQLKKETQLPDVCLRLYCAFHHKYCIFPTISKVKNWGYDGTGINSDNNPHLIDLQVLDTKNDFIMDDFVIKDHPAVKAFVKQMFDGGKKIKFIIMIGYLFYRITGVRIRDVRERIWK